MEKEKELQVLQILKKLITIKLESQDGYYFVKINQGALKGINEVDYNLLKEFTENE